MKAKATLNDVADGFVGALSNPLDKTPGEGRTVETLLSALSEPEIDILMAVDTTRPPSSLQLAEMFSQAAARAHVGPAVAAFVPVEDTCAETPRELRTAGAPAFAKLVAAARHKHGL